MATTKYEIRNGDQVLATKAKKAQAVEFAQVQAKALKTTLGIFTTPAGNLVVEVKARKQQIKTVPYTRVEVLPEGFKVPEGFRVAYKRARKDLAIVHNGETGEYRVVNAKGHALAKGLTTTRAAGAFCKSVEQAPEPANA